MDDLPNVFKLGRGGCNLSLSLLLPPKLHILCAVKAGYGQVIAQGQQLSSLILQLIDEPRVVSILLHQHFLERNKVTVRGGKALSDTKLAVPSTDDKWGSQRPLSS